jgi:hypothetical protein
MRFEGRSGDRRERSPTREPFRLSLLSDRFVCLREYNPMGWEIGVMR